MTTNGEGGKAVFGRYNAELEQLGCGARIKASPRSQPHMMTVIDDDGKSIGDLPMSIEPAALVAVMLLIEQTFEEGVETGRGLERSGAG